MKIQVISRHAMSVLNQTIKHGDNPRCLANILAGSLINPIDSTLYGLTCPTSQDFIDSVIPELNANQLTKFQTLQNIKCCMSDDCLNILFDIFQLRFLPTNELSDNELKLSVYSIISNCDHSLMVEIATFIKAVVIFEKA